MKGEQRSEGRTRRRAFASEFHDSDYNSISLRKTRRIGHDITRRGVRRRIIN